MATYLMIKHQNGTESIKAKSEEPSKPYIKIKDGYFPLTTQTSGTGVFVKANGSQYKIAKSFTTTVQTSSTYEDTYSSETVDHFTSLIPFYGVLGHRGSGRSYTSNTLLMKTTTGNYSKYNRVLGFCSSNVATFATSSTQLDGTGSFGKPNSKTLDFYVGANGVLPTFVTNSVSGIKFSIYRETTSSFLSFDGKEKNFGIIIYSVSTAINNVYNSGWVVTNSIEVIPLVSTATSWYTVETTSE